MPLALVSVSHDVINIINVTIAFHMLRQLNEVQHDFSGYVMPLLLASVSCDADGVINGTIAFLRS